MIIWIIATLLAFFIKGLTGFANTLVFTSVLGFGNNNVNISPVELVLGYPSNFILAFTNRKKLNKKIWVPLAAFVILGSIPGAFLLKNINAQYIKIVFGVLVVLVGVEMLLRESGKLKLKESKILIVVIGVLSGVFCGLFGVGALLAAYVGRFTKSSDEFKANMCTVFAIENTFRIILYSVIGVITLETLKQSVILMPFMLIAVLLGMLLSKKLNDRIVKLLVVIMLIISGIALIVMNVN